MHVHPREHRGGRVGQARAGMQEAKVRGIFKVLNEKSDKSGFPPLSCSTTHVVRYINTTGVLQEGETAGDRS